METQNITLSIPKEVLLKIKLLAVKRQTLVSGLLTQTLERLVRQEEAYAHARQRHLQWLAQGIDLGTDGQILTRRETSTRAPGIWFRNCGNLVRAVSVSRYCRNST